MRIVFFYENAEINAMEDMANELNKKAGTAEEKVEMLREKLSMFSPPKKFYRIILSRRREFLNR